MMCLNTGMAELHTKNWEGDVILFDAVLPSGRPTIAPPHKTYAMDVREYLMTANNAVIRKTLMKEVTAYIHRMKMSKAMFTKRSKGAFDYRVHVLTNFVGERIRYQSHKGRDPWQYPEETLALGTGDCEDIAFVLTSLLLASGISPYNLRVALGSVVAQKRVGNAEHYDHMWVMYKAESGQWQLLEPLHAVKTVAEPSVLTTETFAPVDDVVSVAYQPKFVFNGDHVWRMHASDDDTTLQDFVSRTWKRINPKFAGFVHQTIINTALAGLAPQEMINSLNRHFSFAWARGVIPVVDDVDNFVTHGYDPRDHFDNGFIVEGWQKVADRLAAFKKDNTNFDSFALAAHGIADFYAHSSYGHFAKIDANAFALYDPTNSAHSGMGPCDYSAGSSFDLSATGPFIPNPTVFKGDRNSIPPIWAGQLISGRYAQAGDSKSFMEALTFIPADLRSRSDFWQRGALPHHNSMAVDQPDRDESHLLYKATGDGASDRMLYANQYAWRVQSAIHHIQKAYMDNRSA